MALPGGKTMSTKELKPFDLQAALKGEAVMLRNGDKAYIRHHETEMPVLRSWEVGFSDLRTV